AVRAEAEDVLHERLVVGDPGARIVARELHPDAAEFRRAPIHHDAVAGRVVRGKENRRVGAGEAAGRDRAIAEPVVAITHAPARHELIDGLRVPAGLAARVIGGSTVETEVAGFAAAEVLALQLEVGDRGVAARRPLDDHVRDPERASPAERTADW